MRLTGAGVLVYAVDRGEIHVLLGRERETLGWREGSHKWSPFSGKVEGDENSLEGAAREFMEESCACVPEAQGDFITLQEVRDELRLRARAVEQTMEYKGEQLVYCTYILRVPLLAYEERFAATQARLLGLDEVFRDYYRAKKQLDAVPRFLLPGFTLSSCIVVADFRIKGAEVEVVLHEEDSVEELVVVFGVSAEIMEALRGIEPAWRAVQSFVQAHLHDPIMSHPAVKIVTSRDQVVNAYINRAYLEKCEIRWWPLAELLMEPTKRADSPFRRLFLENLTVLASHIMMQEQQSNAAALAAPHDRAEALGRREGA